MCTNLWARLVEPPSRMLRGKLEGFPIVHGLLETRLPRRRLRGK